MNTDIIRTENISKHYGDVHAVSDMSLNVRKGEIKCSGEFLCK